MAVRAVVRHPVDDDPHATSVYVLHEGVEVGERPEARVDVAVVGHVVAEVRHRRWIERGEPQRLDAELLEVAEPGAQAAQVAHAVVVAVGERARIHLVDGSVLPPREAPPHAARELYEVAGPAARSVSFTRWVSVTRRSSIP